MTFKTRTLCLAAAILAAPYLASCSKYAPEEARQDPVFIEDYPQITVLEGLHGVVVVSDIAERPGPPMHVTVVLRNKSDTPRWIQYRFLFLREGGIRENPEPDWQTANLSGRTHHEISGNAMDRDVNDWRLEIRPAH